MKEQSSAALQAEGPAMGSQGDCDLTRHDSRDALLLVGRLIIGSAERGLEDGSDGEMRGFGLRETWYLFVHTCAI